MIPQRNLSLLSNRLFREQGGRRIPEAVLQRDYCLAWFLATVATHPLREHLAFKGGTAPRRCEAFQSAGKGQMASYQLSWQHKRSLVASRT
jgi:hypothetical protein